MLDLVIAARRKDLGGFEVGRVLPFMRRRMVGPFIFFDHMGPVDLPPHVPRTTDVRPHPHIGVDCRSSFRADHPSQDSVASLLHPYRVAARGAGSASRASIQRESRLRGSRAGRSGRAGLWPRADAGLRRQVGSGPDGA